MQLCHAISLCFGEGADAVQELSDDDDAYSSRPHASTPPPRRFRPDLVALLRAFLRGILCLMSKLLTYVFEHENS